MEGLKLIPRLPALLLLLTCSFCAIFTPYLFFFCFLLLSMPVDNTPSPSATYHSLHQFSLSWAVSFILFGFLGYSAETSIYSYIGRLRPFRWIFSSVNIYISIYYRKKNLWYSRFHPSCIIHSSICKHRHYRLPKKDPSDRTEQRRQSRTGWEKKKKKKKKKRISVLSIKKSFQRENKNRTMYRKELTRKCNLRDDKSSRNSPQYYPY